MLYTGGIDCNRFVTLGSLPILLLSYSLLSIVCVFLVLNSISWCFILQLPKHLVNHIILFSNWLLDYAWLTSYVPETCPFYLSLLLQLPAISYVHWFWFPEVPLWLLLCSWFYLYWKLWIQSLLALLVFFCPWLWDFCYFLSLYLLTCLILFQYYSISLE